MMQKDSLHGNFIVICSGLSSNTAKDTRGYSQARPNYTCHELKGYNIYILGKHLWVNHGNGVASQCAVVCTDRSVLQMLNLL